MMIISGLQYFICSFAHSQGLVGARNFSIWIFWFLILKIYFMTFYFNFLYIFFRHPVYSIRLYY